MAEAADSARRGGATAAEQAQGLVAQIPAHLFGVRADRASAHEQLRAAAETAVGAARRDGLVVDELALQVDVQFADAAVAVEATWCDGGGAAVVVAGGLISELEVIVRPCDSVDAPSACTARLRGSHLCL